MIQLKSLRSFLFVLCSITAFQSSAQVAGTGVNDGHGAEWRQPKDTVGVTWNQLAAVCSQDGRASCAGAAAGVNVSGWVWATDAQVLNLLSYTEPALSTSRSVSGLAYFSTAQTFLGLLMPTSSACTNYSCSAFVGGWTASHEGAAPVAGSVSWGTTPVSASGDFGVGPVVNADETQSWRGAFLFRPTGPGVFAYDDQGSVASPAGGTALGSVLANDWIDGARATPLNVLLRQLSSTDPRITLSVVDGAIQVADGAAAGAHSLRYSICDVRNLARCGTAVVSVTVAPYVITALNDSGSASPSVSAAAIASVLANDSLGGAVATPASVRLALVSLVPAASGITLKTTDGSVVVAAGTAVGTYVLTYEICEVASLGNCARASATVSVAPFVVDAVDDSASGSSKTGGTVIANVRANDLFAGAPATESNVSLSRVSLAPSVPGIVLNLASGAVQVAAKTPSGTYALVYRICDRTSPLNCDTATVTLSLSGRTP